MCRVHIQLSGFHVGIDPKQITSQTIAHKKQFTEMIFKTKIVSAFATGNGLNAFPRRTLLPVYSALVIGNLFSRVSHGLPPFLHMALQSSRSWQNFFCRAWLHTT